MFYYYTIDNIYDNLLRLKHQFEEESYKDTNLITNLNVNFM